jgi:nucleoside-diphosphate-sugar epimerase
MPGGGTTDYAVDIFHKAVADGHYSCYLKSDTVLPMIYIDDALQAALQLMEAPADRISVRTSYNLTGLSFSPDELCKAIQQKLPDFRMCYSPDSRQDIADSWPATIDDTLARYDWGWQPQFDLKKMTNDMLLHLMYPKTVSC